MMILFIIVSNQDRLLSSYCLRKWRSLVVKGKENQHLSQEGNLRRQRLDWGRFTGDTWSPQEWRCQSRGEVINSRINCWNSWATWHHMNSLNSSPSSVPLERVGMGKVPDRTRLWYYFSKSRSGCPELDNDRASYTAMRDRRHSFRNLLSIWDSIEKQSDVYLFTEGSQNIS